MDAKEKELIINDLAAKVKESSSEEINGLKTQLKELDTEALKALQSKKFAENETVESLKKTVKELSEDLKFVKDNANQDVQHKSFEQQVYEQLNAQKDALGAVKGDKNKMVTISVKVPATQTTGNVTLPSATPSSYTYQQLNAVIPATERVPFVQDFTDNAPTNQVAIAWADEVSSEGDAEFIGEGIVKPLIDIDYEIRYSEAKKVAGKIKVSEEALTDISFMNAEITRKLKQRHDLAKQDGILNGNGVGANLKGIVEYAAGFAAGGLALAVDEAQNYDVIVAAYNQILVTSDSNYIPNAVFVHPTDATLMKLTKDLDGNYIMPPFTNQNGDVVNGVRVVQNTKIPLGYFLMGDFSKSHVRNYVDFSIRIGYTGDDFEKNLVTILGESRVHHYISENEAKAFVYDQFSVAKTALETI